jgi:purine-binding chemotaxis protein CheW
MTADSNQIGIRTLIVRVDTTFCAIPLKDVIETMRPLPVKRVAGMPEFALGISVIRGMATPVVSLGAFLGVQGGEITRYVTVRVGSRQVAFAVDEVPGIREIDPATLQNYPPLLQNSEQELIEAVSRMDAQLLLILRSGWLLPETMFPDHLAWKLAI